MARRKKTKRKTKRTLFKLGPSKSKKEQRTTHRLNLTSILKALIVVCIVTGTAIGLVFLEKYVKKSNPVSEKIGFLELVDVPIWVNDRLKQKVYTAAAAYSEDLKLDEDAALSVQQNIETLVAWLDEVKVQTTHDRLLIKGRWRKPLALVKQGLHKFYIDSELVALDFVPMLNLPIVNVKGLSPAATPQPGELWQREDLAAAIAILIRLDKMDRTVTPDKPLLYEIESIDMSNFNGRQNRRYPHVILYAKDSTEIIWGAEFGTWQRHLEAPDEEKLAKLYSYYKQHGSLLGDAKYINLRDPQDNVSQPIDKY